MKKLIGPVAFVAAALLAQAAGAHPHVWVTAKAEIIFGPDRKVAGIRHSWTFDEAYTAYVTQGLDKNGDGKLTPDELQGLAEENTSGLAEFDYFTILKANGKKQAFDAPREPSMHMDKKQPCDLSAAAEESGFGLGRVCLGDR